MNCLLFAIGLCITLHIASAQLTASDRQIILDEHNQARRRVALGQERDARGQVQPTAANMKELVWDTQLEQAAQSYIQRACRPPNYIGHDPNKGRVGENIAQGTYGFYDLRTLTKMWEEELTKSPGYLGFDTNHFQFLSGVAHYTQVVWGTTERLGCGAMKCGNNQVLLCRYDPPGNVMRQKMYERGPACSACPQGSQCNNGLCSGGTQTSNNQQTSYQQPTNYNNQQTSYQQPTNYNNVQVNTPQPRTTTARACEDQDPSRCPDFKSRGFCNANHTWYKWMIDYCGASCGVC